MDPMDFTLEEIEDMAAEAIAEWRDACGKVEAINALLAERKRIENLKVSLGNISADDIARIQTLLSPASIESSEDVRIA
jgi:predicted component of type VI protein secretion system